MKNNEKHIIWNSDAYLDNYESWKEDYIEFCESNEIEIDIDNISEEKVLEYAYELNYEYLKDERANLNIRYPNGIIALADIGRWNGRVNGYKEIGTNIADCLYSEMDMVEWYVDPWGVFRATMADHDGMTFVVYRAWKNGVTEEQKERVLNRIYFGGVSERTLRRYTKNIGKNIADVYGWKVR